jgi:hypothetical protein
MVWRSYLEQHAFIFQDGDVESDVDVNECEKAGIKVKPGLDVPAQESLTWATHEIINLSR